MILTEEGWFVISRGLRDRSAPSETPGAENRGTEHRVQSLLHHVKGMSSDSVTAPFDRLETCILSPIQIVTRRASSERQGGIAICIGAHLQYICCSTILSLTSISEYIHTMRFATLSLFATLWTMVLAEPPVIEGHYAFLDSPRGSYDQICGIPGKSSSRGDMYVSRD